MYRVNDMMLKVKHDNLVTIYRVDLENNSCTRSFIYRVWLVSDTNRYGELRTNRKFCNLQGGVEQCSVKLLCQ